MTPDSIAAGLSSPSNSLGGSLGAAASPAAAQQIGSYFKDLAAQNQDGRLNNSQQAAHVLAHGILAASVAAAGGNDALTAGITAGGAEAAAPYVSKWLYGTDDPEKLSAEQKSTVSAITGLGGAAVGALGGGTATDVVAGSQAAQNAVENNYLTKSKMEEVKACLTGKTCTSRQQKEQALKNAEKFSEFLDNEVKNICEANPLSDACRTGIHSTIQYIAMKDAWDYMNKDIIRSSNQVFDYLYNSKNADTRFVKYFNTIDNRADFFGASNMYESHIGSNAKWFSGAEFVSRAFLTGLGADGNASYITFGAGKVLGNPDIYGWRKEAGDTLITKGFGNFRNLYNVKQNPVYWDIKQLQDEQKSLQPIHEKYLSNQSSFRWVSEKITNVNILDYKSRIEYGCQLLGYSQEQGCKP